MPPDQTSLLGQQNESGYSRGERVEIALSRFLFPGHAVPRRQMVDAVLTALDGGEDFADYLPAKGSVPLIPATDGLREALVTLLGAARAAEPVLATHRPSTLAHTMLLDAIEDAQTVLERVGQDGGAS